MQANATVDRVPQRLHAVSEAALANRRGRAGGGIRGGTSWAGTASNSAGVQKARKADLASQRIKHIAAKLVQRLSSHIPVANQETAGESQGVQSTDGSTSVAPSSHS